MILNIAMINLERKENNENWCVEIGGMFYDLNALSKCLDLHKMIAKQKEVVEECEWLSRVTKNVCSPQGAPEIDKSIAKSLIAKIQEKGERAFCQDAKITVDKLKTLVGNRWVNSEIIDQIIFLINSQTKNVFAFNFNFKDNINEIPQSFARIFHKKWPETLPKKFVFVIHVVKVGGKAYIGNVTIDGQTHKANHYATCFYDVKSNYLIYGDSLGYPIPDAFEKVFKKMLSLTVGQREATRCALRASHCNETQISGPHVCNKNCWTFFPLQTDGSICGIATIVCMCLASIDEASFLSLRGLPSGRGVKFRYLKDISRYNDFLRLTVARWLLFGVIDLSFASGGHDTSNKSQEYANKIEPQNQNYRNDSEIDVHSSTLESKFGSENAERVRNEGDKKKSENAERVRNEGEKKKSENAERVRNEGEKKKSENAERVRNEGEKKKSENAEKVRNEGTKVKSENAEKVRVKNENAESFGNEGGNVEHEQEEKGEAPEMKHNSNKTEAAETETRHEQRDSCQSNTTTDVSHVKGPLDHSIFMFTCKEGSRKCTERRKHFNCALCPISKVEFFVSTIKCHIESSHLNTKRIVVHENVNILPCKRIHPEKQFKKSCVFHYHCPECGSAVQQKSFFEKHLNAHQKKHNRASNDRHRSMKKANGKSGPKKEMGKSSELEDVPQTNVRRTHSSERVQCTVCNAFITAKNLNRHNKTKHDLKPYTAICCDKGRGLYMVRRSHHGGVGFPIHVQKIVNSKRGNVIDCEVASCRTQMEISERSGMRGRECSHLLLVNDAFYPPEQILYENALNELSATNKFRLLKPETVENCLIQNEMAIQNKSPAVVEWEEDNHIHMSVYDGKRKFFPVRSRCIVTYSISKQQLDCRCGLNRCFCLHKAMALWHLYQTEKIGNPVDVGGEMGSEHDSMSEEEYNRDTVKEIGPAEELDTILYPPESEDAAIKMMNYMKTHKSVLYPPLEWHKTLDPKELPVCYKPTELQCHECNDILSGPFKITNKAKIVTMTSVVEGVETYFKICKRCNNYYRYQEFDDGVHNFDDTFLLGIDLCIFLRASTKYHVAVGTACKIISDIHQLKLDEQKVLNAYAHFEAMSERTYAFCCLQCGYYPSILIADLNRKVGFKYSMSNDEMLPDEKDDDVDYVHCDDFWNSSAVSILSKGFIGRKFENLSLEPNLSFWSPYIGRNARVGDHVVNSEHRKIHRDTGAPEADCREISAERLIEELFESKTNDIKKLARKVNVSTKGSKLDIIGRIRASLGEDSARFNKVLTKRFGRSGGWLTVACKHGIIYAVKFLLRAESPRDYIDVLRSLKFKPNVFINDMAHMVAAHGNRFEEGFFSPYEGRVAEATPENIEQATSGTLKISLPWLETNQHLEQANHPVTGSDVTLALFDRFHESNTCSEVEALRRIGCIKELEGKVNSEVAEQLHGSFNKDKHFLNQMTASNHIFLFRSIIDLRNEERNQEFLRRAEVDTNLHVNFDTMGRAVFGNEHIPYNPNHLDLETSDSETEEPILQQSRRAAADFDSDNDRRSDVQHDHFGHTYDNVEKDDIMEQLDSDMWSNDPRHSPLEKNKHISSPSNNDHCDRIDSEEINITDQAPFDFHVKEEQLNSENNVQFSTGEIDNHYESESEPLSPNVCSAMRASKRRLSPIPAYDLFNENMGHTSSVGASREDLDLNLSDSFPENDGFSSDGSQRTFKKDTLDSNYSPNAAWKNHLSLTLHDKAILSTRTALNESICNAAMQIIKSSNSQVEGLQPISTIEDYVGDGRPFIQIIPLTQRMSNSTTWGTLSNVLSEDGRVTLYDSATRLRYLPEEKKVSYDVSLDRYAFALRNRQINTLVIDVARVDTVLKNSMSGVAAIVHAVCLSRRIDPCTVSFNYQSLRRKLMNVFEHSSFQAIHLQSTPRAKSKTLFEWEVPLYCHCKTPYISEALVECTSCEDWFHERCESGNFKGRAWKCRNCTSNKRVKAVKKRSAPGDDEVPNKTSRCDFKEGAHTVVSSNDKNKQLKRDKKKRGQRKAKRNPLFKNYLKSMKENDTSNDRDNEKAERSDSSSSSF
eukprot:Seg6701.2 transcript_id=Seg6701.2/GoldUCD/mRNA.D3Y31 product="hypothetical protein" protein_id=Seg6701.2/GoldUCD/D3Y31